MFDPLTVSDSFLVYASKHPVQVAEHIVAGASSLVAGLAVAQRVLQAIQDWAKKWFPKSRLSGWIGNVEYGVEAATDFVEVFAMNWRQWIAPKPREIWDDSKRQKQLGEKSLSASVGK